MPIQNTWYCKTCKFEVFNSKSTCGKCRAPKPTQIKNISEYTAILKQFDVERAEIQQNEQTRCTRCIQDGRVYNKEPMQSFHNCWKYT